MDNPIVKLTLAREALNMLLDGYAHGNSALERALSTALANVQKGGDMKTAERALRKVQALIVGWWENYAEEDYDEPLVRALWWQTACNISARLYNAAPF
jgi:hypothetical protein